MKIINLIKSEFIKNYNLKKIFSISLIILIITILFVEGYSLIYNKNIVEIYFNNESIISELEKKDKLTNEEKFNLYSYKEEMYYYNYLSPLKVSSGDYREQLIDELLDIKTTNKAIEIYRKNKDSEEIKYICNLDKKYYESAYEGTMHHVCSEKDEIDKIYEENQQLINDYDTLIKENKYYKFVEYELSKKLIYEEAIPLARIVINEKISEPKHYLALNYRHYLLDDKYEPVSKEEFNSYDNEYASYDDYLRFQKLLASDAKKMKQIIEYSSEEKIPHDLSFNRFDGIYPEDNALNTKNYVNFIFHYSIIVMIIVSITSGGIVAKEHSGGTIKKIITAPVKRWKILLSKFIYLILHTYIIWLIALIILSLYSGIKYGFSDLLSPKLIYFNGRVVEVNYYLNLLKDLFIASIPVICFLSILLFLSTVTLNTSLTTGVCSLISVLSIVSWSIVSQYKFLVLTPLMYFDMGYIYTRSDTYMEALTKCNISYTYGIIISILIAALLFVITNIIYNKRDITS